MYKLPKLLPYPGYQSLDGHFTGLYCYILRHPGAGHTSLLVKRNGEDIQAQFGDWVGNIIDITSDSRSVVILEKHFPKIITLLRTIGVSQAQFYFAGDLQLVDVRVSLNKFVGPGMLKDVFGKLITVPETVAIEVLDERALNAIRTGTGDYHGDLLIKPSRYRELELSGTCVPLYAEVRR